MGNNRGLYIACAVAVGASAAALLRSDKAAHEMEEYKAEAMNASSAIAFALQRKMNLAMRDGDMARVSAIGGECARAQAQSASRFEKLDAEHLQLRADLDAMKRNFNAGSFESDGDGSLTIDARVANLRHQVIVVRSELLRLNAAAEKSRVMLSQRHPQGDGMKQ